MFQNATNWSKMEVLDMYIYKFGLNMLDFSYATATTIMKTMVSIFMLLVVNLIVKRITKSGVI